jgi:ATP-binding cassette subfamily B multidrug efflux pump
MVHDDEVIGKAYDARLMRRLLQYLRPYVGAAVLALGAIIAGSVLQLAQPYLMKVVIDRYIPARNLNGIDRVAFLYLLILIAAFGLDFLQTWLLQLTGQRIMFDMRMQVYEHLHRLDLRFYDRNPVGRLMTRVTTDVDAINDLFTSGVVSVFGDVFTLGGIMIVMLSMNWKLAFVSFTVLPLIVVITQWFRRNVRDSYRNVRRLIARINAFLQEHITGMSTVQLFRREGREFETFDAINREHRDVNVRSIFFYAVFYPAVEITGALAAALTIWFGGRWVMTGSVTLGSLVAFLLYSQRFFRPISDISDKFNILQSAMASSERIFKLLDEPVAIVSPNTPKQPQRDAGGHIVFEHVWFAYNEADAGEPDYVLRDVSFEVRPGERVAIVGATGAGKSTVINLLLRFYDVARGRILIDGVDIREMDLQDVRGLFSLVLQDVHLFSGTIAENIRLGAANIDDARVRHAAEAVHAEPFIAQLPEGFAAPVAERGSTLSVGQKQLLSFARALAFDPRILVLDEATSSVDTATEILIRDALRVLMTGRTTIAIAHRLSTIQDMDKILVLHKGQLREAGTHQELLAQRGIYYRLYQLQYRDQEGSNSQLPTPQSDQIEESTSRS